MKVLQIHNTYRLKGGEDSVVQEEKQLLEANGVQVIQFVRSNESINGPFAKLNAALSGRRSHMIKRQLVQLIRKEKPDICHVHNVFLVITPVVYEVCQDLGIPVVQTLHNFRLFCINSYFFRDGHICEDCVKIDKWQGIKHGCYNGSKVQSAVVADTVNYHWAKGTWLDKIDQYITLTPFARQKMIDSGLPSEKLTVKPNFVQSDNSKTITYSPFMLYAGRLESPKGLNDLIHLIETLPQVTFHLVGESKDSQAFAHYPNVKHFGAQPREFVLDQLANCGALLFTSICYEGMPMTILEAMSMKKPVIARNIGAMSSMIRHQENGLHYQTLEELKEHVVKLSNDLTYAKKLGEVAYEDHLTHYDANLAFDRLNTIYQTTIKNYHDEKI